jgi:preprotein translocase subunit SecB
MIKSDDVYADFQYIFHRVKNVSFSFPPEKCDLIDCNTEYDYDYFINEDAKDTHEGTITLIIRITDNENEILMFAIEGFFIGNMEVLDKAEFVKFLEINGITTLIQLSRSIILSMTSNFGINKSFKLPMINVHRLNILKNNSLKQKENENKLK